MQNNSAYTIKIAASTTSTSEDSAVNQSSPTWVLTFIRWENRDTLRNASVPFTEVTNGYPLVVENDCISVATSMNKGTLTPSLHVVLKETDINYTAALSPGDFVFVNMLNWEEDASRVAQNARSGISINGYYDGFKGLYKVQSIRKNISVDEASGTKNVTYSLDAYGFTEFNNIIYFNQNLLAAGDQDNFGLFIRNLSTDWNALVGPDGFFNLQKIVGLLITSFIGNGINTSNYTDDFKSFLPTANVHFFMPSLVGNLLGIKNVKAAKDVYNYLFGLQTYSATSDQDPQLGLSPTLRSYFSGPGFHYTTTQVEGHTYFAPEFWNAVQAWSIIQQYINSPLNEIYTCYRTNIDGLIYPTVVFRQTPFTNVDFRSRTGITAPVTQFLTIPRWSVDSSLVYNLDIGKDEAARVNFVQYFARIGLEDKGAGPSQEISRHNYVFDSGDVTRSGLRPTIVSNLFDPYAQLEPKSPVWAQIVGDALIGGQNKLNGTLECVGIAEPICVGDNLEFEGILFHIESVIHTCTIDPSSGIKRFKTLLKLSMGIDLSTMSTLKYPEMEHTNAYEDRKNDYNNLDQILPGVSESQDTLGRPTNLDPGNIKETQKDRPFPQPNK